MGAGEGRQRKHALWVSHSRQPVEGDFGESSIATRSPAAKVGMQFWPYYTPVIRQRLADVNFITRGKRGREISFGI